MSASLLLRRCRRFLAGGSGLAGGSHPLREQSRRFTAAQTLVRGFYAFLLYFAVSGCSHFGDYLKRPVYAPLWPVAWLPLLHGTAGVRLLLAVYTATNLLGVFFVASRVVRVAAFLGLLEFAALTNSFGKIGHSLHGLVLVAGLLVLLPPGWTRPTALASRALRQRTLLVVWLAGAALLLTYTMSGLSKLGGAVVQSLRGEPNAFLPGAFGAHIAQRLLQSGSQSTLGDWIIHHPYFTWPLMPAAVVIETGAFLAAFRPALGRPVAALLVVFHVGTYFTMTIVFPQSCLLLALFFFASPLEPGNLRWQNVFFALPFAHKIRSVWRSKRRAPGD